MLSEVEVAAVGDPLELRPPDREQVLDVAGGARVVRQLVGIVRPQAQVVGADAQVHVPVHPLLEPVLEPPDRLVGRDEVLHLHLLELAGAEDEVAGGDLVAKALADLGDPERRLLARELEVVPEVQEDALRGLGPQVDGRALLLDRADRGLEHQVEVACLGQVAVGRLAGMLGRLAPALRLVEVVGAEAQLARAAVDERIGETGQVAARLPGRGVLDDRRVQRDDVVALLQHRPPPLALDVVLEQHAVVAVVVARAEPAVDLAAREHEPAPLAQRHDLVHRDDVGVGHRADGSQATPSWHSRLESAKHRSYTW